MARNVVQEARDYIASGAAVGEHLADQVMLPFALAGGGEFTCRAVSQHAKTNAEVIGRFLPISVEFDQQDKRYLCVVKQS